MAEQKRKKYERLLLNLQMVADALEDELEIACVVNRIQEMRLKRFQVYLGKDTVLDDGCLYLADCGTISQNPPDSKTISMVAVMGEDEKADMELAETYQSLIILRSGTGLLELVNLVQRIFMKFQEFDRKLYQVLQSESGSLNELCSLGVEFFENPLFIHDENFNVLALTKWVGGYFVPEMDERTGLGMMPLDIIESFKHNRAYETSLSTERAHFWVGINSPTRSIYMNMWDDEHKYRGRICLTEIQSSLKVSQLILVEYFMGFVCAVLSRRKWRIKRECGIFENLIKDYVLEDKWNEPQFLHHISRLRWNQEDSYLCLKIDLGDSDGQMYSAEKLRSILYGMILSCFAFFHEKYLYVLVNLTADGRTETSVCSDMAQFIRDNILKMGVSVSFHDIFQMKQYFWQAGIALQYGLAAETTAWYYRFQDYALEFMLCHACGGVDPRYVCASDLIRIKEYDQEKNTNHYETLQAYLECNCNIAVASAKLYIHRSTLLYRLNKIKELVSLDLEDENARLYLQLSFLILNGHVA